MKSLKKYSDGFKARVSLDEIKGHRTINELASETGGAYRLRVLEVITTEQDGLFLNLRLNVTPSRFCFYALLPYGID